MYQIVSSSASGHNFGVLGNVLSHVSRGDFFLKALTPQTCSVVCNTNWRRVCCRLMPWVIWADQIERATCTLLCHTTYITGFYLGTRASANLQIRERPRKKSYSEIQAKAIKVGSPVKKKKKGEDKGQALADTSGEARRMMLQEKCYVSWARGFRPHSQKQGEHPWVIWRSHLISNWDQPLLQSLLLLLLHVCFLP